VALLVALDLDGGEQARLLRAGADLDRDGRITGPEVSGLKARLVRVAREHLQITLAGSALQAPEGEVRFSLRQDPSVSATGISVAVLAEVPVPGQVRPGMELVIRDRAPDGSDVDVEVDQAGATAQESVRQAFTVAEGRDARVRAGRLRASPR